MGCPSSSAGDDKKKAFYEDLTAIMSDVFVRTSAGNTGPDAASLANYVP
jgi:hypothetical protein